MVKIYDFKNIRILCNFNNCVIGGIYSSNLIKKDVARVKKVRHQKMAERRMFTKKITDSDAFIELSSSTQALYFHLNQGADDDGFNNQVQNAMFKAHASVDDLKVLLMKNFIIRFESGVIVIKHWRMHNTLRKDRYTPTSFQEELSALDIKENGSYTLMDDGCQVVAKRLPQDSKGKVSKDKDSKGKNSINNEHVSDEPQFPEIPKKVLIEQYSNEFDKLWENYPNKKGKEEARKKYISYRKDGTTYEEVALGLKKYIEYCKAEKIEIKYIKHGSTWFNQKCWNDEYVITNNSNKKVDNQMEILKGVHNGSIKIS